MINYKQTAINVVNLLRSEGVPAWIAGGVAVDIIGKLDRPHKDIDIFIKDYSYKPIVKRVLISNGFKLTREDVPHRDFYISKNKRVGLDIFYGTLYFGRFKPKNLDYNSYVVDINTLRDSLKGKVIKAKYDYDTVVTNVNILDNYIEEQQVKATNIQQSLNIIK